MCPYSLVSYNVHSACLFCVYVYTLGTEEHRVIGVGHIYLSPWVPSLSLLPHFLEHLVRHLHPHPLEHLPHLLWPSAPEEVSLKHPSAGVDVYSGEQESSVTLYSRVYGSMTYKKPECYIFSCFIVLQIPGQGGRSISRARGTGMIYIFGSSRSL